MSKNNNENRSSVISNFLKLWVLFCLTQISCLSMKENLKVESPQIIKDISFIGENELWLLTSQGKVFYLNTERKIKKVIDINGKVEQLFFINPTKGWILNSENQIWLTQDGGVNWYKKGSICEKKFDAELNNQLIFINNKDGWLINSLSVWITRDGGESWAQIYPNEKLSYTELVAQPIEFFPINSESGALAMTNDKILKIINHGRELKVVTIPRKLDVRAIFQISDEEYWVGTWADGGLFFTKDDGRNWEQMLDEKTRENIGILSIEFQNKKMGWIVGLEFLKDNDSQETPKGVILKTQDGGKTWSNVEIGVDENRFNKVKFDDEQKGWLVGEKSVYKTDDGGNTWKKVFEVD